MGTNLISLERLLKLKLLFFGKMVVPVAVRAAELQKTGASEKLARKHRIRCRAATLAPSRLKPPSHSDVTPPIALPLEPLKLTPTPGRNVADNDNGKLGFQALS